jgi:hypothetical protein
MRDRHKAAVHSQRRYDTLRRPIEKAKKME